MIALNVAFWLYVIIFALVGAMRGWAKELLVTFSVILSMFIITILERFVPFMQNLQETDVSGTPTDFWIRLILLLGFSFFGYQTPRLSRISGANLTRDKVQDVVMGLLVGAFNGFLIIGTLWFYLDAVNYSFTTDGPQYVIAAQNADIQQAVQSLLDILPPTWLTVPWIYFAVAIAFAFVVIVFV